MLNSLSKMSTVYAKAKRLQKEKEAKERKKKAEKERLEQEGLETKHLEKERMEKESLAKEAEEQRLGLEKEEADKKAAESQLQDGKAEVNEEGDVVEENRTLDRTEAKRITITAFATALATARIISDILIVHYPEGVSSPLPELNQNAKEGKFWYIFRYKRIEMFP